MPELISKKDYIHHVFEKYPSTMKVFINNSMRCVACELNRFATIEECCINHKVKNLDNFILNLNESKDEDLING